MKSKEIIILEKELLSLFSFGMDCLRKHKIIKFTIYKKVKNLLSEGKIIIIIQK